MLSDRQKKLLDFIVREYVRTAEPVGSALVFEKGNFDVSPATIRNEMMALEDAGYLMQPHTSAGRVPTDKAYRLFVNVLLASEPRDVAARSKQRINAALADTAPEPRTINRTIAHILNELTDNLVIVNDDTSGDFYQKGLASLLEFPEFREFHRTLQVMNFFDQFDELFRQVERQFFSGPEVQLFIGRENPFQSIVDEAMIHAKYRLPGNRIGSVTVIGPIRMDYEYNLGLVNYTADTVNKLTDEIEHERK